jgi:hypothetical protein
VIATKITTKITAPAIIPITAPVCKPLLEGRADAEGEGVLAWFEVLIVNGTDVVLKTNIVVARGEELVIAISKNKIISKNNSKWD